MEKKVYEMTNQGMIRDTSISKRDNKHAYENFNIRITANDKETLLTVTNEKGHKEAHEDLQEYGTYLGHCIVEDNVIVFFTNNGTDYIVKYNFYSSGKLESKKVLFQGNLNFDEDHPIETLGQVETNQVKKVYWVDGKNITRVINFYEDEDDSKFPIGSADLYYGFDFMPNAQDQGISITCDITKSYDGSGYMKPGTIQYFLTLYHKMGTETGVVWASPLCYPSFEDRGGSPEETTPTKFTLKFYGIDPNFEYARLYAYGKSSENTSAFAYIVDDVPINSGTATFVDNGADNTDIDTSQILFLGGQEFIASTLIDKNGKLFLGNINYNEADYSSEITDVIKANCFKDADKAGNVYECNCVTFYNSESTHEDSVNTAYPYEINLGNSISGFKRGNKYRFGIQCIKANGALSRTYWIGDAIADSGESSDNPILYAKVELPTAVTDVISQYYNNYRLMYVKPSASDRLVVAQGVVNPTVFNMYERYKNRSYVQSSWVTRPIGGGIPNQHYDVLAPASNRYGEIQNFDYDDETPSLEPSLDKIDTKKLAYRLYCEYEVKFFGADYYKFVIEVGYVTKSSTDNKETFVVQQSVSSNIYKHKFGNDDLPYNEVLESLSNIYEIYPSLKDIISLKYTMLYGWFLQGSMSSQLTSYKTKNTYRQYFYYNSLSFYQFEEALAKGLKFTDILKKSDAEDNDYYGYYFYCELRNDIKTLFDSYIVRNKNAYFIDESIVSFNSPDVVDQALSSDALKFRLVGISKALNNTFSYDVNLKSSSYSLYAGKRDIVNVYDYTPINTAIVNAALFNGAIHNLALKDNSKNKSESNPVVDTVNTLSSTPYYLYMWQSNASIENYSEDNVVFSEIDSKIFCNRYYGSNTVYFKSYHDLGIDDMKNTYGNSMVNVVHDDQSVACLTDVDSVLNNNRKLSWSLGQYESSDDYTYEYKVYTGTDETDWTYNYTGGNSIKSSIMRYKSDPQVVISLNKCLPSLNSSKEVRATTILNNYDFDYYLLFNITDGVYSPFDDENADDDGFFETTEDIYNFLDRKYNITILAPRIITKTDGTKETSLYYICKKGDDGNPEYITPKTNKPVGDGETTYWFSFIDADPITLEAGDKLYSLLDGNVYVYDSTQSSLMDAISATTNKVVEALDELCTTKYTYTLESNYGKEKLKAVKFIYYWIGDLNEAKKLVDLGTFTVEANSIIPDGYDEYFKIAYDGGKSTTIDFNNPYLYICEIYRDADVATDFGGITENALSNNVYYPCSIYTKVSETLVSNEGDTYYQRYDALRTKPYSDSDVNQVVDICSVMLETYTNLDGRYDTKRYTNDLLTIDWNNFAPINYAYSSDNNVITGSVLDDRYQNGDYSSSIVHSLVKEPNSLVDTWSNVTLASIVGLDSDKGPVNKLTKYSNNIYAFQDKAIEQILYDERTQITPSIGVPIEIANSATVSHAMITDMYGSKDKRSIVTTKSGLYFYDYNNGVICSFGEGVKPLSTIQGFDIWVREHGDFTTFYDKRHGDIYFLTTQAGETDYDTLCYNEYLENFTSFYKYGKPDFMFNLYDHWMSYKDHKFWINNEGEYGNIYGDKQGSSIEYKIIPTPYSDKLFTNVNYRTDFFDDNDTYQEAETFTSIRSKDEYQESEKTIKYVPNKYYIAKKDEVKAYKKFRIWNTDIPRMSSQKMDRSRNMWVQLKLTKDYTPLRYEFHNANVIYYE